MKPLLDGGLCFGGDTHLHVGNVVESARLLGEGSPPWGWLPDIALGHGGPNYLYYGHLGFVLPALLTCWGLSPEDALRASILLGFLIAATSSFLWCSRLAGKAAGLIGAMLFLYGPYCFTLPYVRGSYPEFWASALYPLLLYYVHRCVFEGERRHVATGALVLGLILGIHTLSLILIVPFLCLYTALAAILVRRPWAMLFGGLLVSLAILVAAPFLWGPIFWKSRVAIHDQFAQPEPFQSLGAPWYTFLNKAPGQYEVLSHLLPGRVHCILFAIAIFLSAKPGPGVEHWITRVLLLLAGVALALTEHSVARWSVGLIPVIGYLQYPFRFLSLFNLFVVGAFARTISSHHGAAPAWRTAAAMLLPPCCVFVYLPTIAPQNERNFFTSTLDGLRSRMTTLDHENKYMPTGSKMPSSPAPELPLTCDMPDAEFRGERLGSNAYRFETQLPEAGSAIFHQYWFPGWEAELDGAALPLRRDGELGLCALDLPSGEHSLRIRFVEPWERRVCTWVSAVTAAGLLATAVFVGVVRSRGDAQDRSRHRGEPKP